MRKKLIAMVNKLKYFIKIKLMLAAKRLNILPEHCLAIEDTPKGAAAAKRAGMSVAAINPFLNKSDFAEIDLLARNFAEIDTWIRNLIVS